MTICGIPARLGQSDTMHAYRELITRSCVLQACESLWAITDSALDQEIQDELGVFWGAIRGYP